MMPRIRGLNLLTPSTQRAKIQLMSSRRLAVLTRAFLACFSAKGATTVSLRPVADTSLLAQSIYANNNFGGGNTFVSGGRPNPTPGGSVSRGLLLFDIAGNVPAGATINS